MNIDSKYHQPTVTTPTLQRSRGKVAGTRKTSEVIVWPNMTAAEFGRLPGHEKTAVYFQTCTSRLWQARWHHDFLLAFDWFSMQLSIRERNARQAAKP